MITRPHCPTGLSAVRQAIRTPESAPVPPATILCRVRAEIEPKRMAAGPGLAPDIAEGFNQGALTPGGSVQVESCTALWLKALCAKPREKPSSYVF